MRNLLALHPTGLVEEPVNVVAMVRDVVRARAHMISIADHE